MASTRQSLTAASSSQWLPRRHFRRPFAFSAYRCGRGMLHDYDRLDANAKFKTAGPWE